MQGYVRHVSGLGLQDHASVIHTQNLLSSIHLLLVGEGLFHREEGTMTSRTERDSFGVIEVPAERLWGAQTQRSLQYFHISTERMPQEIILALSAVKRAAALVNRDLGLLNEEKASAIVQAADEVLAGQHDRECVLSVWQTGSGTQSNMNMNEVLANRASELLGGARGWPAPRS